MKYGDVIRTVDSTVYIVQTTFPGYRDDEAKPDKFGTYVWTAYTCADDPGHRKWFFKDPRYEALMKLDRADYDTLRTHRYNDSLVYLTPDAAIACASALRDHAVLSSPYEHSMDWAIKERGMKLLSRVVEKRLALIERIVEEL